MIKGTSSRASGKSRPGGAVAPVHKPQRKVHQVRIIGGQWKRTPLPVPDAEGLRPTPDRVRETVFNWLGHLFDHEWDSRVCLDLFAGSGALGFEAASRGAARVVLVDNSTAAVRQLQEVKDRLGAATVEILRADSATAASRQAPASQDVIFLDPPYHQGWLPKILPVCAPLLKPHGVLYLEAESPLDPLAWPDWLQDWQLVRGDKAGMVFYHLLQRKSTS